MKRCHSGKLPNSKTRKTINYAQKESNLPCETWNNKAPIF